jgi:hypothetical protein
MVRKRTFGLTALQGGGRLDSPTTGAKMDDQERSPQHEPVQAEDEDLELAEDAAEQVTGGAGTFTLTFQGQTTSAHDPNATHWVRVSQPH